MDKISQHNRSAGHNLSPRSVVDFNLGFDVQGRSRTQGSGPFLSGFPTDAPNCRAPLKRHRGLVRADQYVGRNLPWKGTRVPRTRPELFRGSGAREVLRSGLRRG
jgi:hypothetical protein